MKKLIIIIFSFYLGLIIFMPKENLFFTLQKYLSTQNIYINPSNIDSNIIKLELKNNKIYINKINLINIENIKIFPYILFNYVNIKNLIINKTNLKNIKIYYTLFYPIKVFIKGDEIDGIIDFKNRFIKVYIKNKSFFSYLKKDKKGYFYYEKF